MTSSTLDALAAQWRADLASWAIPAEILDQAEVAPWAHPVAMFLAEDEIEDAVSHRRAREAMPSGGTLLDVGCGGGRSSFPVAPPAATVMGVDEQQGMLDAFADAAVRRGLAHREFVGQWPAVAMMVPECDVVVCHHVAFNVAEIVPFVQALHEHARRRVVLELPMHHPMSNLNPLWARMWGLERPTRPTAVDLLAIIRELGHDAQIEVWFDERFGSRTPMDEAERLRMIRRRLCLPPEREAELAAVLAKQGPESGRELACIWWDVTTLQP